ncbi:hypothetical protein AB0F81_44915 [Actinoplanes sp. NPDC024001]|uniref:hypothetical protein n=1 Tax=Actinoplanes sp. NPDC024001 TaxID=3154598 RepID=UPI0033DCDD6C
MRHSSAVETRRHVAAIAAATVLALALAPAPASASAPAPAPPSGDRAALRSTSTADAPADADPARDGGEPVVWLLVLGGVALTVLVGAAFWSIRRRPPTA